MQRKTSTQQNIVQGQSIGWVSMQEDIDFHTAFEIRR